MKVIPLLSLLCSVLSMLFLMPIAVAQNASSENALVKQFYPRKWLTPDNSMYPGSYAYADAAFNGDSKNSYIVAAYSDGLDNKICVLERQGDTAEVIATPSFPLMIGGMPRIDMIDVDGDGVPEVDVSFTSANGRNSTDWILKWNGTTLVSIGPAFRDRQTGYIESLLSSPAFMDLTGNGKMDLINSPEDDGQNAPINTVSTIYSLVNGQYQKSGSEDYVNFFSRSKGTPTAQTDSFPASDVSGKYVMTMVNGSGTGKLVSSATITLNGVTVASKSQFSKRANIIAVPVTLQHNNTISVTLKGDPGAQLTVLIGTAINP